MCFTSDDVSTVVFSADFCIILQILVHPWSGCLIWTLLLWSGLSPLGVFEEKPDNHTQNRHEHRSKRRKHRHDERVKSEEGVSLKFTRRGGTHCLLLILNSSQWTYIGLHIIARFDYHTQISHSYRPICNTFSNYKLSLELSII